ncbi:MAG: RNA polymerase sigma factor [Chitinophagaceae bacterium]|nr:RNA polymerase sigma factor [Rubrivivax sp.]
MKITAPTPDTLAAAQRGDLAALDRLLATLQPGIFNLALRVLGQRDDAADATQEILLKIVTHLGGFRGEAAFTTWIWRVAHNHLLSARTAAAEAPHLSLDALAEKLNAGLEASDRLIHAQGGPRALTPQDKLEARQVALGCTQSMLMALDREDRLVYVLDTVFDLPSAMAAEVVGVTPAAYRQRLSRSRARLAAFTGKRCGLVSEAAACRCERQLPVLRQLRQQEQRPALPVQVEGHQAEREFDAFVRVSDAAALFRAHPEAAAPAAMLAAIRAVLTQEGFLQRGLPQ